MTTLEDIEKKVASLVRRLDGLGDHYAPIGTASDVDSLLGWRRKLQADDAFGRILNGPQWISGTSIRDGAVDASKITVGTLEALTTLTGALEVSDSITSGTPGAGRVQITTTGLFGYNASNQGTFKLGVDGSGFLGLSPGTLRWTTVGAVTVDNTLTIASGGKIIDADGSYWDQGGI
ncbi:MAG: hypothetical protein RLZZ200_679, partial [Pseudomonadota bacterium]